MAYSDPNFNVIREKHITGAISVATAVDSAFVGSTFRSFTKAVVLGVQFRVASGGSAAGSNSFKVARINSSGTVSVFRTLTQLVSAGASAAHETYTITLPSASVLTVHSIGEGAVLIGQAASLDKIPVLGDVIWFYRFLPVNADVFDIPLG